MGYVRKKTKKMAINNVTKNASLQKANAAANNRATTQIVFAPKPGEIKVFMENGYLVICMPYNEKPDISDSGKSRIAATSKGFYSTGLDINGKALSVSINAITKL